MRRFRWLGVAGLAALLATAACGKDEERKTGTGESPLCAGVTCTGESECNPNTGECHCGEGDLICRVGSVCVLEPSPSCISDRCEFTTCTDGQSCDPLDGLCKCGSVACETGEQCIQGTCVRGDLCRDVSCPANETCDASEGVCRCGDGAGCGFGEVCDGGVCKEDPCAGNPCGRGLTCSPDDGLCHCGDASGPVCSRGEACVSDEAGNRCEAVNLCADAESRCGQGTVCDPDDGSCRCGGVGDAFPICTDDQVCHDGRCIGGEQCLDADTRCTGGNTCDPEDGVCKCGGLFGDICASDQVCHLGGTAPACVKTCNPLVAATGCETGQACAFEVLGVLKGQFYCGTPGFVADGGTCKADNRCMAGFHCDMQQGQTQGRCRKFCAVSDRGSCGEGLFCAPLANTGDEGICVPR